MTHVEPAASDFPESFLWGVATASYQIEGAATEGGRGPSIWDTFSHTNGRTLNGDTGDVAVDHYHRYQEDVGLMAELGVNAYRFSIAWSRLIPDGVGEVNPEGVQFYRNLCTELIARGIKPSATLYHWDLPQALQDRGGWANPDSVKWFAEYARVAKEALGDLVTMWATLNEPWCTAFLGHSAGEHAPGIADPGLSYVVAHHLMLAHHAAIRAMRTTNVQPEDELGIVLNLIPAWPADDSDEAIAAAAGVDAVSNGLFSGAVLEGRYPDWILDAHDRLGVAGAIDNAALASATEPIDFLGMNYYNINHVAYAEGAPPMGAWPGVPNAQIARPPGDLTDMGWGVEPVGLTWMLERIGSIQPDLPIVIMENGSAYPDKVSEDGAVQDHQRTAYLESHIGAVAAARSAGVNVAGYFVWSLLDNFEWARGYSMRFGIVRVDYDTMERTIKDSGYWYKDFLSR
ncbi:MAG: GH1 family beta-glucosidase [Acidimicrobiia bacterium]